MKKNNRGFLLAESLVVSTFVLTVLILLYIQFNNLTTNYKNSYNYNNVESIYDLSSVSNYLLTNNYNLSDQLTESKPYVIVYKDGSCNMDAGIVDSFCDNLISQMDAKTVIYTSSDISIIQKYVSEKDDSNINQKLREFISRVETNTVQNKGRLFAEFNNDTYATIAMDLETTSTSEMTPIELCRNGMFVSSGDGLYADTYETGRCIYKGANPNNFIMIDDSLWRIISIETDGTLKVISTDSLSGIGWTDDDRSNWNQNPKLNKYLNETYYASLSQNVKNKIQSHVFYTGNITALNNNFSEQISSERNATWTGNVGLINASDYIKANTNVTQCGNNQLNNTNVNTCQNTNYLNNAGMTINKEDNRIIFVQDGSIMSAIENVQYSLLRDATPVIYLKSDLQLTGTGTQANPYQIQ